jgi:DNA modification methylase
MRHIVRAALPFGIGIVFDPFMGAGSTIAAAVALGYESVGLESDPDYFRMAGEAIPRLAQLPAIGASSGRGGTRELFAERSEASSHPDGR